VDEGGGKSLTVSSVKGLGGRPARGTLDPCAVVLSSVGTPKASPSERMEKEGEWRGGERKEGSLTVMVSVILVSKNVQV